MAKHPFPKFDFSILDSPDFKEDSVREELIQPILKALGYSVSGENKIIRSKVLSHPFVKIGSKKNRINIIPDYLLQVQEKNAWILDAKAPPEEIQTGSHVEQAYSYAIHPDIRVKWYALCNGRKFVVFDVENTKPIFSFNLSEILASWSNLYNLLSPKAITSRLKGKIIEKPAISPNKIALLPRVHTGKELIDILLSAYSFMIQFDDPTSEEEAKLLNDFHLQLQDQIDMIHDCDIEDKFHVGKFLSSEIEELEKNHFHVFGEPQRFDEILDELILAKISVIRDTSETIFNLADLIETAKGTDKQQ